MFLFVLFIYRYNFNQPSFLSDHVFQLYNNSTLLPKLQQNASLLTNLPISERLNRIHPKAIKFHDIPDLKQAITRYVNLNETSVVKM